VEVETHGTAYRDSMIRFSIHKPTADNLPAQWKYRTMESWFQLGLRVSYITLSYQDDKLSGIYAGCLQHGIWQTHYTHSAVWKI
jgi:hypothetical protein